MTDNTGRASVAARLHELRDRYRLTIQEMAARCALPKSTLESYMQGAVPKRPGLDALVAIADGFDVSLDWLTGRSATEVARRLTLNDYALACYNAVHSAVHESLGPSPEFEHVASRLAARAMLAFKEAVELYDQTDWVHGDVRREWSEALQDAVRVALREAAGSGKSHE